MEMLNKCISPRKQLVEVKGGQKGNSKDGR